MHKCLSISRIGWIRNYSATNVKKNKYCVLACAVWVVFLFPYCMEKSGSQAAQDLAAEPAAANVPVFPTDSGLGKYFPKIEPIKKWDMLPENAVPWGGVVSHHALTGKLIDEFFFVLSKKRKVDTFILLSPGHFKFSKDYVSVTGGSWKTPFGFVKSDTVLTENLAVSFGVGYDDGAFYSEHGVSTLVPFIKKYFPEAKVAAVLYEVLEHYSGVMVKKYADGIYRNFQAGSGNFLLISSDFTHGVDLKTALAQDKNTAEFFSSPTASSWQKVTCDNMPAIYAFSILASPKTKVTSLYRTNCLYLAPNDADPNDITSYFFSYFWEEVGRTIP